MQCIMGRPQIELSKKRSKRFIFRLTEDELEKIVSYSKACGLPPGAVVREKLFKGRFPAPKIAITDLNTYLELKKIGVNINQLAKKANSGIVPIGLLPLLMKLLQQQDAIIYQLTHDSQSENR